MIDRRTAPVPLLLGVLALVPVVLVLTLGCAPRPAPASSPTPTVAIPTVSAPTTSPVQVTLDRLTTAARDADRTLFQTATSPLDPQFAASRDWLFTNLSQLDPTALRFIATGLAAPLPADRTALLPGGWQQDVAVRWSAGRTAVPITQTVTLNFVPSADGAALLAGIASSVDPRPTPLWLLGPLQVTHADGVTVLGAQPSEWVEAAETAAAAVQHRLPEAPTGVVVQIAADEATFERVLGVASGSYRDLAAVAWPMAPEANPPVVDVIVNGALAGQLSRPGRIVLLTHETVHVATRSVDSPAPLWLVEGYADQIAYDRVPAERGAAAEAALADVDRYGPPAELPGNERFAPGADALALSYAQAWLACRYAAETFGADRLDALYSAVDNGRPLAAALPETLGVDEAAFVSGWRHYLVRRAAAR